MTLVSHDFPFALVALAWGLQWIKRDAYRRAVDSTPPMAECGELPSLAKCSATLKNLVYAAWIAEYTQAHGGAVLGLCGDATHQMTQAFPELRRVPGLVHFLGGGTAQHWWCVSPDGAVVDPTVSQYLPQAPVRYEELEPGQIEALPTGRCMNCGDDAYRRETFCSEACEKDFVRWQTGST